MRYINSRYYLWEREEVYRIYVSDTLAGFVGNSTRYADLVKPQDAGINETRTAPEIIDNIMGKLRGA